MSRELRDLPVVVAIYIHSKDALKSLEEWNRAGELQRKLEFEQNLIFVDSDIFPTYLINLIHRVSSFDQSVK